MPGNHIPRQLEAVLGAALAGPRKVLVVFGPRQVGKTTLLRTVAATLPGKVVSLNGDWLDDQTQLRPEKASLTRLLAGADYLLVDEAQNVPEVGTSLKLVHDHFPSVRVLATGSSSFDLARRTGEPLTGRQRTFLLFPLSYHERDPEPARSRAVLEEMMVFGGYPEVALMPSADDKAAHLRQLAADYILKDVFAHVDVNRRKLLDILRLVALQVGEEVSLSELGRTVQIDTKTVGRYLDLLESAFLIVRLRGFSRNLRKEVGKSQKVYFLDLGIRNAIIQRFEPPAARDDVGRLWENLFVVERMKRNVYAGVAASYAFWRTYDRQEIDLIEEHGAELRAFEIKWGRARKRMPRLFVETYPHAETAVVVPETAPDWLSP